MASSTETMPPGDAGAHPNAPTSGVEAPEAQVQPGAEAPNDQVQPAAAGGNGHTIPEADLLKELRSRVAILEEERAQRPARRVVSITPRSVVEILAMIIGVVALVAFVSVAWGAITFVLIALLIALALNPAVAFFCRRGLPRGLSALLVGLLAVLALGVLGLLIIPPLVTQVTHFINSLPNTLNQLSKGHGPLGFLERKFHVVQQANKLIHSKNLGSEAAGAAGSGISVALSVAGSVVGLVVIAFLTFFMLIEGPGWVESFLSLLPDHVRPRFERVGSGISRTVGGFVTGNLLASILAGAITAVVLFIAGLPYPVPLGVLVAFLDLLPIFGAFVAIAIVALISFFHGLVTGLVVTGIVFAYHQVEVYYLRPLIYGSMIKLSPLAVLVAATIGTEIAGPLGAIAAIPVGGAIQLIIEELLDIRDQRRKLRSEAQATT